MSEFFDLLDDLCTSKTHLLKTDEDFSAYKYNQYNINAALAQKPDLVVIAEMMNRNSHLSDRMHYNILMAVIPKAKRYGKWPKAQNQENLDIVMERYGYNRKRALEVLDLFSDDDLKNIKLMLFKGGANRK